MKALPEAKQDAQQSIDATKPLMMFCQDISPLFVVTSPIRTTAKCSLQGTAYSLLVSRWLAKLEWPKFDPGYHAKAPGVSWTDPTGDFILATHRYPCLNHGQKGKQLKAVDVQTHPGHGRGLGRQISGPTAPPSL